MTNRMAGHWSRDGRLHFGVGIEDTFVPQESVGARKLDEYELTQHYTHWRSDLQRAADAGATLLRWGIPWYRVETQPGVFEWSWLDEVAAEMERLSLRCIVDLMHYGTPLWLDNQFLNASYAERVASYSRAVAERYRGVWDDFTPLNEPVINAIYCGEKGLWPPGLTGQDGFVKLTLALSKGMVLTQRAILEVNPDACFVHVDAGFLWQGTEFPLDREVLAERQFLPLDLIMGRVTESHPMTPYLQEHGVTGEELDWFHRHAVQPDIIGVNYYPAFTTTRFEAGQANPVEAGTDGLEKLTRLYSERYGLPLAITETSRGGPVQDRVEWLTESVESVNRMRAEGLPVCGYIWFPFFALVDWLYREATTPVDCWFVQMGLLDLRRDADGTLVREPTEALSRFQLLAYEPNDTAHSRVT